MSTVAEIVNREQTEQARRIDKYTSEREAEKKRWDSKQFSGEVAYIIKQFEYNVFKLSSTNKEVANFITGFGNGRHSITRSGDCDQTMPGYVTIDPYLGALKFEGESDGRQHITKSSKYNKWKKALEKKFGVNIYIKREYSYRERFETYDDEIFQGVVASVQLKK